MLPAPRVRELSPPMHVELVASQEVGNQYAVSRASALSVSSTVSAGPSWAMVRTLTLRFLELFQDVADHQQALLRLLPPGVFFL